MRNLARKLMTKTLTDALALPDTTLRSALLQQAQIALVGFEAAAHDESAEATKRQQAEMFNEEVRITAEAVKKAIKEKR